ncbi:hypothetical protein [Kineococcus esterisolvens]|uniref:hypothetical protein n=1 Tax=unclassified Kineococcus TaxID=2621656 RepID=UPI003D7C3DF5
MKVRRADSGATVTVTGAVHDGDGAELGDVLRAALGDGSDGDVLLEAHGITEFDDGALQALASVRSRAKHLHRGFAVLDDRDGATARSLRRSGHIFRIPVHADADAARSAMSGDRARTAARNPRPDAPVVPMASAGTGGHLPGL